MSHEGTWFSVQLVRADGGSGPSSLGALAEALEVDVETARMFLEFAPIVVASDVGLDEARAKARRIRAMGGEAVVRDLHTGHEERFGPGTGDSERAAPARRAAASQPASSPEQRPEPPARTEPPPRVEPRASTEGSVAEPLPGAGGAGRELDVERPRPPRRSAPRSAPPPAPTTSGSTPPPPARSAPPSRPPLASMPGAAEAALRAATVRRDLVSERAAVAPVVTDARPAPRPRPIAVRCAVCATRMNGLDECPVCGWRDKSDGDGCACRAPIGVRGPATGPRVGAVIGVLVALALGSGAWFGPPLVVALLAWIGGAVVLVERRNLAVRCMRCGRLAAASDERARLAGMVDVRSRRLMAAGTGALLLGVASLGWFLRAPSIDHFSTSGRWSVTLPRTHARIVTQLEEIPTSLGVATGTLYRASNGWTSPRLLGMMYLELHERSGGAQVDDAVLDEALAGAMKLLGLERELPTRSASTATRRGREATIVGQAGGEALRGRARIFTSGRNFVVLLAADPVGSADEAAASAFFASLVHQD